MSSRKFSRGFVAASITTTYDGNVPHYCLNCGNPLVVRPVEGQQLEACESCDFVLWRDPKVVTVVVVEDGAGEVVLGRRGTEPGHHGGDQGRGDDQAAIRAFAGVLGVGVEGVEVSRETDVPRHVRLGDGPAPGRPLSAQGQVFEMNEFQEVLQGLCACEYNQHTPPTMGLCLTTA